MKLLIEKKHRASKGGWKPGKIVKGMPGGRSDPKQAQKELAKRQADWERAVAELEHTQGTEVSE